MRKTVNYRKSSVSFSGFRLLGALLGLASLGLSACGTELLDDGTPDPESTFQTFATGSPKSPGTNTQQLMPDNLFLGDLDGDGKSDLVQYSGTRVFASGTDFNKTGFLHAYLPRNITRLFIGAFSNTGKDEVCAVMDDGGLRCYGASTDKTTLWWWFTQNNPISASEDIIVADFDGNNRDDLMLYNRSTGAIRFMTVTGSAFFAALPNVDLGNLAGAATAGMQFRAGDFDGDGRFDLLALNSARQVLHYASVSSGGKNTFWWAYTTKSDTFTASEEVTVARVNNDASFDVVFHNTSTGAFRFFLAQYDNQLLKALTGVQQGQLGVKTGSRLFWGRLHGSLSEQGAINRDDALVVRLSDRLMVRSDARWSGSAYTYWWAYDQYAPKNHTGWASYQSKPWLILKCKFSDVSTEPKTDTWLRELFTNTGWEGVVDYWRDISYGAYDVGGSFMPTPWYTMSITKAQGQNLSRYERIQKCLDASGQSLTGYVSVVALINDYQDSGAAGGRVLLDPWCWNTTCATHEMGHGFGWDHSFDNTQRKAADWSQPGEYYDHWDIMSAMNVHTFSNHNGVASGPEMTPAYKTKKNFIPSHRITKLTTGTTLVTTTLTVATLNRPENNAPLMIRFGASDSDYYTIEFRQKIGWDRGIPNNAVLVHQVKNGVATLITGNSTTGADPDLTLNETRWLPSSRYVKVKGLDTTKGLATVEIRY